MIKMVNVGMAYGGRQVLHDIGLEVRRGETMVVIGPSGSGKSTILKLIIGLLKPTCGQIWLGEREISRLRESEMDQLRLKMGMVFQYSALFDFLSVGENVAFGLRRHGRLSEAEIRETVARRLRMVGLSGRENVMPNELSGGMKKRVGLARAIAFEPEIVLYDEPTAGLDPIMSGKIDRLIRSTQRLLGVTSVVVTHHMESAFRIADRIAMIYEGRVIETGTVAEMKASTNAVVQQFIHGFKKTDEPTGRV